MGGAVGEESSALVVEVQGLRKHKEWADQKIDVLIRRVREVGFQTEAQPRMQSLRAPAISSSTLSQTFTPNHPVVSCQNMKPSSAVFLQRRNLGEAGFKTIKSGPTCPSLM